ncbi:hypothetical protein BpHYR1_006017 [Brachionus plicatilis]|uniref:Uncharacterized protein n=1 Tax=Brachionus plicatilis TaxID=10195 RepID=A0A3M7R5C8_BRAPC|nr:hypothetical protein BpHYR1_006017 [Brachionus plicatilis]
MLDYITNYIILLLSFFYFTSPKRQRIEVHDQIKKVSILYDLSFKKKYNMFVFCFGRNLREKMTNSLIFLYYVIIIISIRIGCFSETLFFIISSFFITKPSIGTLIN